MRVAADGPVIILPSLRYLCPEGRGFLHVLPVVVARLVGLFAHQSCQEKSGVAGPLRNDVVVPLEVQVQDDDAQDHGQRAQ